MAYAIGVDFGTESCRAVLIDQLDGSLRHVEVIQYTHGVITKKLNHLQLKSKMILQNPNDYLEALITTVNRLIQHTKVIPQEILSIGIDFTSCTCLPVDHKLQPLCNSNKFKNQPHAYSKLWKSHSAEKEATYISSILENHPYLDRYGGVISSEWLLPKLLEILNDSPEVFHEMEYFMEAGDWIVSLLSGEVKRSSCLAGYKGLWQKDKGYIENNVLKKIHPEFEYIYQNQLSGEVQSVGTRAGNLTEEFAEKLGLSTKTVIGMSIIDAHAAVPASGISEEGILQIVMGTSSCHLLLSKKLHNIPGISSVVEDGILPGYYAYEAGQVAVGDIFASFVKKQVPKNYFEEAIQRGITIFELLDEKASKLEIGQSGMVALDWHNGNRTPFVNANFSSVLVGETLDTEAHEKYRTLLESTAFGTKVIVDLFEENEILINKIIITGGIPTKNPFLMQIYADVLQKEILVVDHPQIPALGAAIIGALSNNHPITKLSETVKHLGFTNYKKYLPDREKDYSTLYSVYQSVSQYFGNHPELLTLQKLKVMGEEKYGKKFMGTI